MTPQQLLDDSTVVHEADNVRKAIAQMAVRIDLALRETQPILMPVLQGGLYLAGQLMPLLHFPLHQSTVHVSRYSSGLPGDLIWHARPEVDVVGRTVLLVDDVFDEGITLSMLASELAQQGAQRVFSAVLANKVVDKKTEYRPDFVALECGPEYLFGCGMDCQGFWRNLPEIRAVSDT